jgi:glucose/arabinose dehydrogenase
VTRWLVAAVLVGCAQKPTAPVGLRVPLTEGWAATPHAGGLSVGPKGRVVASLELRGGEVPRAAELSRAVSSEGATHVLLDDGEGYAAVRYTLAPGRDGFLAVKRVGGRTVWCSSTANARDDEVDDALALCRNLSTEAP